MAMLEAFLRTESLSVAFRPVHQLENLPFLSRLETKVRLRHPNFIRIENTPLRGPGERMAVDVEEMEGNDKKPRK